MAKFELAILVFVALGQFLSCDAIKCYECSGQDCGSIDKPGKGELKDCGDAEGCRMWWFHSQSGVLSEFKRECGKWPDHSYHQCSNELKVNFETGKAYGSQKCSCFHDKCNDCTDFETCKNPEFTNGVGTFVPTLISILTPIIMAFGAINL